jgi:hypothetical protein
MERGHERCAARPHHDKLAAHQEINPTIDLTQASKVI